MSQLDRTLPILSDLIALPTVSSEPNRALIDHVAQLLDAAGARVSVFPDATGSKANLFATIGPERDGGIVLSGHTDVVPAEGNWTSDPFRLREADNRLYGRGSCDMKGFIACALAMAEEYAALRLTRPVHFAFTHDEEVGCLGGQRLIDDLRRLGIRPAAAIIGEPTEMRIIEGHKGCFEYTTVFTGREGHASQPARGVNAIEYAVRYVARLMELGDAVRADAPAESRFDPPFTTVQVGLIDGGTARNVIAGRCAVEWEMRPVRANDADRIRTGLLHYCAHDLLPSMRAVAPESDIETFIIGEVAGLEPATANEARDIVAALTGSNSCDVVSFGTEAGLFQAYGMSAVVCGPGSIEQAHKPDEFVSVGQLQSCLAMLDGLKRTLTA